MKPIMGRGGRGGNGRMGGKGKEQEVGRE